MERKILLKHVEEDELNGLSRTFRNIIRSDIDPSSKAELSLIDALMFGDIDEYLRSIPLCNLSLFFMNYKADVDFFLNVDRKAIEGIVFLFSGYNDEGITIEGVFKKFKNINEMADFFDCIKKDELSDLVIEFLAEWGWL